MKRECGSCSLCCKLVPVAELNKPGNTRCKHQRMTGCAIYAHRPISCQIWMCAWLAAEADTRELSRPDRTHYVIDISLDFVVGTKDGVTANIPVIQVWADPRYPDCHRDPALRALIRSRDMAALVRFNNADGQDAILIFPMENGEWYEHTDTMKQERQHTPAEVIQVLRDNGHDVALAVPSKFLEREGSHG